MDGPEFPDALRSGPVRGRGAGLNPANRFESVRLHVLGEFLEHQARERAAEREPAGDGPTATPRPVQVLTHVTSDRSHRVINHVDSPDIPFEWTLNLYRGCEHGCIYCYARPTHEYLGFSCGLDFETRIVVKPDAPDLLRDELADPAWRGEPIALSGVTDCYQPAERELGLTRRCLELFVECRQPCSVITKSRLILRDLDLLRAMAEYNGIHVAVSVTTLDNRLAASLEPRASAPAERLETIRRLADAGIPVQAMIAPIIPGLTDVEVPRLLEAVADAGARHAGWVLLRLPHQTQALFLEWLGRCVPQRAAKVEALVRETRGGQLNDATCGRRMVGEGPVAEQIRATFALFARRHGLHRPLPALSSAQFRRPAARGQGWLFEV